METINDINSIIRKVTLSCRVLPEQKLFVAECAKRLNMTLSQYAEAKILKTDTLELEKIIQQQKIDLEYWKAEVKKLTESKTRINQELTQIQNDFIAYDEQNVESENIEFKFVFKNAYEKEKFIGKLSFLTNKYETSSLLTTLKLCVDYTVKNDKSFFIMKTVKEFFQKKLKNKLFHLHKTK